VLIVDHPVLHYQSTMSALYPSVEASSLTQFIGRPLSELPTPGAILHEPTVRRNCARLVDVAQRLGIGLRPHVKTHKVTSSASKVVTSLNF